MALIFFLIPIAEIFVFIEAGNKYGYFNAIMATIVAFILGLLVVQSQGRAFFMRAQNDLRKGNLPTRAVVHSLMVFMGGVFLMIPGFITDIIGLALILPGIRHVLAVGVRSFLAKQIERGRVHVFSKFNGFGFETPQNEASERDVSPIIIDVTPTKSEHTDRE